MISWRALKTQFSFDKHPEQNFLQKHSEVQVEFKILRAVPKHGRVSTNYKKSETHLSPRLMNKTSNIIMDSRTK